jgi:hypothetical protein
MPIVRKRFPLQPAFRDPHQTHVPIVGANEFIGPGGSGSAARVSGAGGGGDTVGHMRPPKPANLAGVSHWNKAMANGGLPEGQRPKKNAGKGWRTMSIHGPE